MASKSITFFTNSFPVLSQTFVVEQINGLIELGHTVNIVSIYPGDTSFSTDQSITKNDLIKRTRYLLPTSSGNRFFLMAICSIFLQQLRLLLAYPSRVQLIWFSLILLSKRNLKLARDILKIGLITEKKTSADCIIAHFGHIGVIANYLRKSHLLDGRLFTVFHGYEISEYKQIKHWKGLYRWLGNTSDLLLPISELWANRLKSYGVPNNKIKVHHMGIDVNRFKFENRPLSSTLNILTVARATEKKGLIYALEAIEKCSIPLKYHIVGGGELLELLKSQVKNYKRKDDIIFHGPQTPDFVAKALKNADVFLLPSVTDCKGDMEGIPVSLMEAMASGVLVISTIHSGIPELIDHNESGFLVPEKDSNEIKNRLERLNSTVINSSKIKNNAVTKVNADFNAKDLNNALSSLMNDIP
jgi:colanic acid/amylovoran biosynthesis glycosyltransferase